MTTLLLIHGGLWDDMDAERFWHKPGIVAGLHRHGITVLSPNRAHRAPDWASEVEHLTAAMPNHPVTVIAGSNGCSAAVRLTLVKPEHVERLLLAWAPTAGDPDIDARTRRSLTELGAPPHVIDTLLTGQTLRGVTDDELATITKPVGVLPSVPENTFHQRRTVDALLHALPHAVELPGSPEPPHPDFPSHAESFIHTAARFALT
jgi:pimeloyl-ACP methyl ester carboxylesterase